MIVLALKHDRERCDAQQGGQALAWKNEWQQGNYRNGPALQLVIRPGMGEVNQCHVVAEFIPFSPCCEDSSQFLHAHGQPQQGEETDGQAIECRPCQDPAGRYHEQQAQDEAKQDNIHQRQVYLSFR